jgi:serine/tyrosine/threonine adenylyltransferase
MTLRFDNSYLRDLPGTYLRQDPVVAPAPQLLAWNDPLAAALGLQISARDAAAWFSGATVPPGAEPAALAYAGHQFGGFSPQLGDGRAHLLGEFLGPDGRRWDLQLKGSGRTPFSRGGDGRAAVGPMLREFVISEAMAALGVPTTRCLAVVATGEDIWRDAGRLPGAVVARVAASHIRVGTFQFFSARGEMDKLEALIAYTLQRHFPGVSGALGLFDAVIARQAALVAKWMGLGFIHGVMNTDNMALSGETIDYGPCAFMDNYAPGTVFSSIDRQGRYAYANQPLIMGWNLARLAETLLPFLDTDEGRAVDLANGRLEGIAGIYRAEWLAVMRAKLGLVGAEPGDEGLIDDLLPAMVGMDWTLTFRRGFQGLGGWRDRWLDRVGPDWQGRLVAANPAVIPRNHRVEAALEAATAGDMAPFDALLSAVRDPYSAEAGREGYVLPAPEGLAPYVTYCGT